ncbi:MAG: hypothetical protein U0Q22_00915 [Acidimicrobiales bacterium]
MASVSVRSLVRGTVTFRLVVAFTTSAAVTAAIAGPMACRAFQANERASVAASVATTTAASKLASADVASLMGSWGPSSPAGSQGAGLFVSRSADHDDASPLEGARLSRTEWLFFCGPGVVSVRFYLDTSSASGPPTRVAGAPFDLGPAGFDVGALTPGPHTLLAAVTTLDRSYRRLATFTVVD